MTFNYLKYNVWHEDYPQHKLSSVEAMCKRGAEMRGFKILKSQLLIPITADKHKMKAQEA